MWREAHRRGVARRDAAALARRRGLLGRAQLFVHEAWLRAAATCVGAIEGKAYTYVAPLVCWCGSRRGLVAVRDGPMGAG